MPIGLEAVAVAIYTEANAHIGLGHLRRCLSLAMALDSIGSSAIFLLNPVSPLRGVVERNYRVIGIESRQARSIAASCPSVDALVLDSYALEADAFPTLRDSTGYLVVLDDEANRQLPVDLVVNPSPAVDSSRYTGIEALLGPRFALLRPEFGEAPSRSWRDKVERVLITVGGSDHKGLTSALIAAAPPQITLVVVVGPFFSDSQLIGQAAQGKKVELHRDPTNIRDLMLSCDMAITGGGQTVYELAATGTPAIAIQISDNQKLNLKGMAESGAVVVAGSAEESRITQIVWQKALGLTLESRIQMSDAGRSSVDGLGARRVALAIREGALRSSDGTDQT